MILNIFKYGELSWTEMRRIIIYRSQILKYPIRFCAFDEISDGNVQHVMALHCQNN